MVSHYSSYFIDQSKLTFEYLSYRCTYYTLVQSTSCMMYSKMLFELELKNVKEERKKTVFGGKNWETQLEIHAILLGLYNSWEIPQLYTAAARARSDFKFKMKEDRKGRKREIDFFKFSLCHSFAYEYTYSWWRGAFHTYRNHWNMSKEKMSTSKKFNLNRGKKTQKKVLQVYLSYVLH